MSTSPYADVSLRDYQAAELRLAADEARTGIKIHAAAYVLVNVLIASVNLVFVPQFLFFFFPLAGWGIGLTMHYVLGYRKAGQDVAARQARATLSTADNA